MTTIVIAAPAANPGLAYCIAQTVDPRMTLEGVQIVELTDEMLVGEAYARFVKRLNALCRPKESLLILGMQQETLATTSGLLLVWAMARLFSAVRVVEMIRHGRYVATRSSEEVIPDQLIRYTLSVFSVQINGKPEHDLWNPSGCSGAS